MSSFISTNHCNPEWQISEFPEFDPITPKMSCPLSGAMTVKLRYLTFVSTIESKTDQVSSFTMILLAEIADKTFFIAAIMAMRYNKLIVFMGAWSALVLMTALSVAMGFLVRDFESIIIYEF